MRLVTKINFALAGVAAISAMLSFATLKVAVMPSFTSLEEQIADRNQSRVLKAIELQKERLANSAGDYATWDDTHDFVNGVLPEYEEKNLTPGSLHTLGVNYFVAIDLEGKVLLDRGYDYSGEKPRPIKFLTTDILPSNNPLVASKEMRATSALTRTDEGLVVIGYAPILYSDRSGDRAGTLVFGRILDVDALKSTTEVDFDLLDGSVDAGKAIGASEQMMERGRQLIGLDGKAVATLVSHTPRDITAAGARTVLTALVFLLGGAAVLLVALGIVLRKIVVNRIEALRSHLVTVASTGSLESLPEDGMGDELSETVRSFNAMAQQLADLRDRLRRQDYDHGAADQAAGLLHNVRNAISPVSALAWELSRSDEAQWKRNVVKAIEQLREPDLAPDRAEKLDRFIAMSVARMIEDDGRRQKNTSRLVAMLRHIDDILKETDGSARLERVCETIDLEKSVRDAVRLVDHRHGIEVECGDLKDIHVRGHKVPLDQILANLIVNAADAIEASANGYGRIQIMSRRISSTETGSGIELAITDDGVGIEKKYLGRLFDKGYSTKPDGQRGLGLHWCANAINVMGGRLAAESMGHGMGATFIVTLPSQTSMREAA